jgi:hypothetical protein
MIPDPGTPCAHQNDETHAQRVMLNSLLRGIGLRSSVADHRTQGGLRWFRCLLGERR